MHKNAEHESYGADHRIFDCPWCGAIAGIDPEILGQDYPCPECEKTTKLTEQNTRRGHLTDEELQPQESYRPGHRTFDCPWCGAIAGISPSHVGEDFTCPECHRHTKLTEKNVRDRPMVEAPKAAPHHAEAPSRWPLALVALLVVAGVVWVLASGQRGGTSGDGGGKRGEVAKVPAPGPGGPGPSGTPGETPPVDPGPDAGTPPIDPSEPLTPPPGVMLEKAKTKLAAAKAELTASQQVLVAWGEDNPALAEVLKQRYAREKLGEVLEEHAQVIVSGTPADARALNASIRDVVGENPDLIPIARLIMGQLTRDIVRPVRVASWRELNFAQPRVTKALKDIAAEAQSLVPPKYDELTRAVADASGKYDRARAALEAAEKAEAEARRD